MRAHSTQTKFSRLLLAHIPGKGRGRSPSPDRNRSPHYPDRRHCRRKSSQPARLADPVPNINEAFGAALVTAEAVYLDRIVLAPVVHIARSAAILLRVTVQNDACCIHFIASVDRVRVFVELSVLAPVIHIARSTAVLLRVPVQNDACCISFHCKVWDRV